MLKKNNEPKFTIKQIIPVPPGWTLKYVWIDERGSHIESISLIGQALVEREDQVDSIEFYGYYDAYGQLDISSEIEEDLCRPCTSNVFSLGIFQPNEEPDQEAVELAVRNISCKKAAREKKIAVRSV